MIRLDGFGGFPRLSIEQARATPKIQKTDDDSKLREQTDAFEALIIKNMLDISLKMDDPLYPKSPGHEIYQSMYKDMLSQSLSGGFGYSELLYNYLKAQQKEQQQ